MSTEELASVPIQNSKTTRVKALIPLKIVACLNALRPYLYRVIQLCRACWSHWSLSDCNSWWWEVDSSQKITDISDRQPFRSTPHVIGFLVYITSQFPQAHLQVQQPRSLWQHLHCSQRTLEIVLRRDADGCWISAAIETKFIFSKLCINYFQGSNVPRLPRQTSGCFWCWDLPTLKAEAELYRYTFRANARPSIEREPQLPRVTPCMI